MVDEEAWFLILEYLSFTDILVVSRVSREARQTCLAVLRTRHKIEVLRLESHGRRHQPYVNCNVDPYHAMNDEDRVVITSKKSLYGLMDFLRQYCPNISVVSMTGLYWIQLPDERDALYCFIASEYAGRLECISGPDLLLATSSNLAIDSCQRELLLKLVRLKHLKINSMTATFAGLLRETYPRLQSLDVYHVDPAVLARLPFGIKRVKISATNYAGYVGLTESPAASTIEDLILAFPMEPLNISDEESNGRRNTLAKPLKNLVSLELLVRFGEKPILVSFLKSLPFSRGLKHLTMDMGMNYTFFNFTIHDKTFASLFSNVRNLKTFKLSRYIHETTFVSSLVHHCDQITKLHFLDCGLTNESLAEISLLPFLEDLEIQSNRLPLNLEPLLLVLQGNSQECLRRLVMIYTNGSFASDEVKEEVILVNTTFQKLNTVYLKDNDNHRIEMKDGVLCDWSQVESKGKKSKRKSQRIRMHVNANPGNSWRNQVADLVGQFFNGTPWFMARMILFVQFMWIRLRDIRSQQEDS